MKYNEFLQYKVSIGANKGFKPLFMPDTMFDFQKALTSWAVEKGRAALFCDCGLGKTLMQLTMAQNVVQHTNKPALILTPLAVAAQTVREGEKFGIECTRSKDGKVTGDIVVANYQRLHYFNPDDFSIVVLDESSILKSFDGQYKDLITKFMRRTPYRLLATATAAPNDYIELGTSSEALGYMGFMDMLTKFFKNDNNNVGLRRMFGEAPKWRFKGHAEIPFWRWVASWARACRMPSDIGFDNGGFDLPELVENEHLIEPEAPPPGMLFAVPASNLPEQRKERKRTIKERCEKAAELAIYHDDYSLLWCHMNDEAKLLKELVPDSIEVSGSDSDDAKEEKFLAFLDGEVKNLISKPKIGAWGLNFQHCNHVTYFPSHSFEQYYQAIRRCWRFGQQRPVNVDIVFTEGERKIINNMKRKAKQSEEMFKRLVNEMNDATGISKVNPYVIEEEIPSWL